MSHVWLWRMVFFLSLLLPEPSVWATDNPLVYAVVVGNNDGLGILPQLRYADDDALRFYRLAVRLAPEQNVALLTELDVDTWRRIQLSSVRPPPFLPPTKRKLVEVFDLFKRQIAMARRQRPDRPVHFYFFFSGHGEQGYFLLKKDGSDLTDSVFTGTDLRRTFADSRATLNGLFIDACKSQSLFMPKGRSAEKDDELGPDFNSLIQKLDQATVGSPIGIITSTLSDKPAGEARDIQGGYFSHVLTSGLSGAADANSDGVILYSELAAFVSFHTRRIAGQVPWFRPPDGEFNTPLIMLKERRDLVEILPGIGGHFVVFDRQGRNLLLEVHKSEAQWTRLILAPGQYQVIWVRSPERGFLAKVDLTQGPQRLMFSHFFQTVALGQERAPKGEAEGAPPEPEETADLALHTFDPVNSGFEQPFTPRVVSAMITAYRAGRNALSPSSVPNTINRRHLLSVGYGLFSPPVEPLTFGQGVSLGYAYRLRLPLQLGGRATFAFSDHPGNGQDGPFKLYRFILQAEGRYIYPLGERYEAGVGAYLGWQMVFLSREEWLNPGGLQQRMMRIYGDPAGFSAGLTASLRVSLAQRFWVAANIAWGIDLLQEETSPGVRRFVYFLRPQLWGQVGYAF